MSAPVDERPWPRSDAEILARTRILIASLVIYLLSIAFMTLVDRLYVGAIHPVLSRLAVVPFFLLLLRRYVTRVRVRPPEILLEARRLVEMGRPQAARERYEALLAEIPPGVAKLERARRILQDGLAITVEQEARLGVARCSALLGELDRAEKDLSRLVLELPSRAEVALELAETQVRSGRTELAAQTLGAALPHLDRSDRRSLAESPTLARLAPGPPPARSAFSRRILGERLLLAALLAGAVAHGLHFYLGLF
jgi:hypothetical protein